MNMLKEWWRTMMAQPPPISCWNPDPGNAQKYPPARKRGPAPTRPCDRCGGMTHAAFEVTTQAGCLYFCSHHHAKHIMHIKSQNYIVRNLKK
jgi:hypothetical protein